MQRCFDLARLGAGNVAPNPMVGAVLVHEGRIIGEGWHRQYGHAHAEVNALANVKPADRHLIGKSTLYVSLEPCNVFGKTPPCTDLILKNRIPKVVISCLDQSPEVSGRGVGILRNAGVEVITGILKAEGEALSAIRNTFVTKKRPYILLKYACSRDGFMGKPGEQIWINNAYSKRFVHRMRSEAAGILVGTNTALTDNPQLDTRHWFGNSPLRIVLDRNLRVPDGYFLRNDSGKTWLVTEQPFEASAAKVSTRYLRLKFDHSLLSELMANLYDARITSLIVEGGAFTLQKFIDNNFWDEAYIFTSNKILKTGIPAPHLTGKIAESVAVGTDLLTIFSNTAD